MDSAGETEDAGDAARLGSGWRLGDAKQGFGIIETRLATRCARELSKIKIADEYRKQIRHTENKAVPRG
jgi:hypothetical protein